MNQILLIRGVLAAIFIVSGCPCFAREGDRCDSVRLKPATLAKYHVKVTTKSVDNYGNVNFRLAIPETEDGCRFKSIELMRHDKESEERITLSVNVPTKRQKKEIVSESVSIIREELPLYKFYIFYGENPGCGCVDSYSLQELEQFIN